MSFGPCTTVLAALTHVPPAVMEADWKVSEDWESQLTSIGQRSTEGPHPVPPKPLIRPQGQWSELPRARGIWDGGTIKGLHPTGLQSGHARRPQLWIPPVALILDPLALSEKGEPTGEIYHHMRYFMARDSTGLARSLTSGLATVGCALPFFPQVPSGIGEGDLGLGETRKD